MKYLFILGRNPELSKAEVFSWLTRKNIIVKNHKVNKNSLLIEINQELNPKSINELGGVISIGEILSNIDINELDDLEIYSGKKNNFSFVLWDFSDKTQKIREYLKQRFKDEKLKASEKPIKEIKPTSKLIDIEYFVFENYFGIINQFNAYKEIEERDMKKPIRREELSISPRLAKIMINLSEIKENEILLDCFSGIGVILQEALLQGIKVIGVDIDEKAIQGAKQNLQFAKFNTEDYELINTDSSKIHLQKKPGVIVTEPDLGAILKQAPSEKIAEQIQFNFENLMTAVLNNLKKQIPEKARIVFTAPLIQTDKRKVSCNYKRILEKTKLKLVEGFPIQEFRENQIIGRDIFVFER